MFSKLRKQSPMTKLVFGFSSMALALGTSNPAACQAYLYTQKNFGTVNDPPLIITGTETGSTPINLASNAYCNYNNDIESVKVAFGVEVRLYKGSDCVGPNYLSITSNTEDLGDTDGQGCWSNVASCVQVFCENQADKTVAHDKCCVTLTNFDTPAKTKEICPSFAGQCVDVGTDFNDETASFDVTFGTDFKSSTIEFFQDTGCPAVAQPTKIFPRSFSTDEVDLGPNNGVSSLRMECDTDRHVDTCCVTFTGSDGTLLQTCTDGTNDVCTDFPANGVFNDHLKAFDVDFTGSYAASRLLLYRESGCPNSFKLISSLSRNEEEVYDDNGASSFKLSCYETVPTNECCVTFTNEDGDSYRHCQRNDVNECYNFWGDFNDRLAGFNIDSTQTAKIKFFTDTECPQATFYSSCTSKAQQSLPAGNGISSFILNCPANL